MNQPHVSVHRRLDNDFGTGVFDAPAPVEHKSVKSGLNPVIVTSSEEAGVAERGPEITADRRAGAVD